jgi:hypothetical protein
MFGVDLFYSILIGDVLYISEGMGLYTILTVRTA